MTSAERPIRRVSLFDQAVTFFTKGGWIGIKLKNAPYHILVGFTPAGMSVHKTIERTNVHVPVADVSNEGLELGLDGLFSEILRNEIDPTADKFRGWTALIPWSTSPDTPFARKLIVEDGRTASLTLAPLIELGPIRSLHALYDVIPMARVNGRQFKWALAYSTRNWRKFSGRTMRWLHGWGGRYYMISDRKRTVLLKDNETKQTALLRLKSGLNFVQTEMSPPPETTLSNHLQRWLMALS